MPLLLPVHHTVLPVQVSNEPTLLSQENLISVLPKCAPKLLIKPTDNFLAIASSPAPPQTLIEPQCSHQGRLGEKRQFPAQPLQTRCDERHHIQTPRFLPGCNTAAIFSPVRKAEPFTSAVFLANSEYLRTWQENLCCLSCCDPSRGWRAVP